MTRAFLEFYGGRGNILIDFRKYKVHKNKDSNSVFAVVMFIKVTEASYKKDFMIDLVFSDGKTGTVDLEKRLYGEMFAPLKDKNQFKAFHLDPVLETIVWENGADFAPEFLYEKAVKN